MRATCGATGAGTPMSHRDRTVWFVVVLPLALGQVAPAVPPEYRALYDQLAGSLTSWERRLPDRGPARPPVWAAELLPANGNRGEDLLTPRALEGSIVYLEALRRLGIQGVKVAIPYPLLDPAYPRSADYARFYRQVAAEVRRRQMVLLVGTGPAFTDPSLGAVGVDYRALTFAQFREGRRRVAHRIAREIRPDYLTVGTEPTTEAGITGFVSLRDPILYAEMIRYILQGLPEGPTRLGAGAGNWESSSFAQRLAALPGLDYIDLHVYPVGPWMVARAQGLAGAARSHGRGLVIGEAWLYKVSGRELGRTTPAEAFRRDVFSFWSPLDQRFVQILARWAWTAGAHLVSFFWSTYLFAYLDYDPTTAVLPYGALRARVDRQVVHSLLTGQASPTGQRLKTLIASLR